jgi:aspartyl-tRNA(Asn)/glutamyl-tRNA(Gln) amidotransferase subunit A
VVRIAEGMRDGALSASTLVRDCLARIRELNPQLRAFVTVYDAAAREAAERCDRERAAGMDRGPLHGVPVAIKDNIDEAGQPTSCCSAALRDNLASTDAECVMRLREAGAIIIGRTNMHELAYGGTGEISAAGPALNPWDTSRLAGGSSSGSAVAVASGMVPAALGSDTGGSVRIPSALCGIVGFKPSIGSISTRGVVPLSWTLDHVGPMTSTVGDAAIVAGALARSGSALEGVAPMRAASRTGALTKALRIGVARFPGFELDPAVGTRFQGTLEALQRAGCQLGQFELQYSREAHASWLAIMCAEATARFETLLGERYHDFAAGVRTQLEAGRHISATTYLRAQRFRAFYGEWIAEVSAPYDVICMPTLPTVAPKVGQETVDLPSGPVATQDAMTFSNLTANMLGWPAVTLPMRQERTDLPAGITLLRPAGQDRALLADASFVESLLNNHPR